VYAEALEFLGLRPWELKASVHRNRASYDTLDPVVRRELEARYAEPNARLAELLGRDFGWSSAAPAAGVEEHDELEAQTASRRRG
jgi:hypothetical protein